MKKFILFFILCVTNLSTYTSNAQDNIYPSADFYFQVLLDNETYIFKEVSGISLEASTEEITEGGENRFKYKLPSISRVSNLELKRGLVSKNSKLLEWINNSLLGRLDQAITTKTLEVSLLSNEGEKVIAWSFVGAWPISWNSAQLNSMNNEVLIESMSLSYKYMESKRLQPNAEENNR